MWRDLDTLDVTSDLSFLEVKAGVHDFMNIRVGRAMLYINEATSGFATPAKGPLLKTLQIGVWNGATELLATALVFKAVLGMIF